MISLETLNELLRCDPIDGRLYWRERAGGPSNWNSRFAGKEAFTTDSGGYRCGRILSDMEYAHRIIWAMTTGAWPKGRIDHANGDKSDNRIQNLRDVTCAENSRNQKRYKNNASGVTGVHWDRRREKWQASIKTDAERKFLGQYDCFFKAVKARKDAETKYGYHANHGRTA